ncbi:MAG: 5-deoxy-glucuronate isomerase [Bermanella sp.]|jgi:5-deoxy-glucuronate isomerase
MHIPPYENKNEAIVAENNSCVPLNYFNIVKLSKGQSFTSHIVGYESCIVPATGTVKVDVEGAVFDQIGNRGVDVWDGEPEGVYVPVGTKTRITCLSESAEIFVAGAKYDKVLEPFSVGKDDIDFVQYGSDDTKTHRKIKHIFGQKQHGKVGRLLVSELYTVGKGGWSGFPTHKHDTDDLPHETRHDETYNFRFRPKHGAGLQLLQPSDDVLGEAYQIVDGSTVCIDRGYHPCVAMPGYEMYYFTILSGLSQRSLVQNFQNVHADQVNTIPGIKDMVAKFK